MKFEYYVTEIESTDPIGIRAMLSQFGQDGWELVSASGLRHTGRTELAWSLGFFIFKRRIESLAQKAEVEESEARKILIEKSRKVYQLIRPLLIDGVAICTRGLCPQFDSALLKCKSASVEGDTAACSIWYERERQTVPQGTIRFVREQFESKSGDSESAKEQPDGPQTIRPLFIDGVAACTGGNCEQFDIIKYECALAGAVNHVTACPVWYKRKGKQAPSGTAQFIQDREPLCPEPEDNWEPLVKEIERVMDHFVHPCSRGKGPCDETTENRCSAVEIVLRAIENAGYEVFKKGNGP